MNDLINNSVIEQNYLTPIEMALGVDEQGMTTARKLYEFLELSPSNYSKWCRTNIIENDFAEENVDYWAFVLNDERNFNPKPTTDYRLTAHFAKKLSVKGNSEKAEQAREYFTRIEEKVKQKAIDYSQLSPELRMFYTIADEQARIELQQKRQAEQIRKVENRVESIREVVAINSDSWRTETSNLIKKIGIALGGGLAYSEVRNEIYGLLEKRMGVNLGMRLTNKRRRMAEEGVSKTARDKVTLVDVIAEDKKLIEGYIAIVKETAIKYGVGK
nr:MAG TPA: AntA/AntB antirepressor [Caudoviricetes sp.]